MEKLSTTTNTKDQSGLKIYFRLLSYLTPYLLYFFVSILSFAVYAGSQVAATEWLKRLIDFVNNPIEEYRWILPLALVLIALLRGISFFIGNYLLSFISNKIVHALRTELFHKLTTLPSSFFDNQASGHLVSRITFNVMQVTGAVTNSVKILIREGLLVIGLVIYLMLLNWQLALILFIAGPFIAVIVSVAAKRLRKISNKIQTAMGDVTHVASEAINAYREVKSFGGEEYENNRFLKASENNRIQNLKLEATNAIASPLVQIFLSSALALITWLALDPKVIISMSSGAFIAFFGGAAMLAKPVRQLSEVNSQIQKGLAAATDIFSQLDEDPETNDGIYKTKKINGEINFKNVSFSYDNEVNIENVLKDINLTIFPGQTIAFVGKSGAGKTSLLSLIPRFYSNYSGDISVDGVSLEDYEIKNLRSHISLVSQNVTLFNDTVAKNINYGSLQKDFKKITEASEKAHADSFIRAMPDGYDTLVGDDGVLLSGGQRQRIAIARAILKDSPILILDEATSALDSESEQHIQEAMKELTKNRTTLIIAHRLSTIENSDKIVVLDEGRIVEEGTHKDLLLNKSHYASLHKNQFKDSDKKKEKPIQQDYLEITEGIIEDEKGFLENSWYKKRSWLWLLWPISFVVGLIVSNRRSKFKKNPKKSWKPKVPVIVVGNIMVGGTGKTPLVIWLTNSLKKLGYKPGVISRGYGGRAKSYPLLITENTSVINSGDEPLIIFKNTSVPVYVSPNRAEAARRLVQDTSCDVIISDDGMQHYSLGRDVEIAVFDGNRGIGNKLLLPAGPLREPLRRLREVDFIVSSNSSFLDKKYKEDYIFKFKPIKWIRIHDNSSYDLNDWPLKKEVNAVAGIGNPSKFFNLLKKLGFNTLRNIFPDHYQFNESDLIFTNNLPIIMTEKDAVRCSNMNLRNLWYLKVEVDMPLSFAEDIARKIKVSN